MRTKIAILIIAVLVFTTAAFAQEKAELFGGYSFMSVDTNSSNRINTNGWNAALSATLKGPLGVTADFDGHYGDAFGVNGSIYNFMFGPKFTAHFDKGDAFAHALIGGSHASASGFSDSSVAWALGGGVDLVGSKGWGVRLGQIDYIGTKYSNDTQAHFRFSAGIVYQWK